MDSFKQKLGSFVSLLALIVNLIPPQVQPAHAAENSDPPSERVHQQSEPAIIPGHRPLTPIAASAEAVMPRWFKPPVASSEDLAAAAGLSLAKPPAIANLPEDRSSTVNKPAALAANDILPSWFETDRTGAEEPGSRGAMGQENGEAIILPDWFNVPSGDEDAQPAAINRQSSAAVLPDWFASLPSSLRLRSGQALLLPPARPLQWAIPASLLAVDVTGPDVTSLGAPVGAGEVFTAVIRNDSSQTAYGIYLTATHETFLIHDGGDQLLTRTGSITFSSINVGPSSIEWTPGVTVNLAPGEVITLNFKLRATCSAQSGQQMRVGVRYNADPPPATPDELNTDGLNVTTGRGNLVIKKEPALQNLGTPDFGKPITWIVTAQSTGLGKLYNATIIDTGGISLSQPGGDLNPTASIAMLDINESQTYTVVGTVEACNFTNVAQGSWTCGNLEGDATVTNPVQSMASVLFTPQVPNINLQVSPPLVFPYCERITRTVTMTVTNTGGPGGNFRLDSTLESNSFLEVIPGSVSSGWNYVVAGGIFSYTGGSPTGTIPNTGAGGPLTLTFQVRPQSAYVCVAGNGDVAFTPLYEDICDRNPFVGNIVSLNYQYAQGEAPTLQIAKSGPEIVASGDVFTYQITVSGQNPVNINGPVNITDILPAQFALAGPITASAGVANTNGQTVTWSFDPPDAPAAFNETLIYEARAVATQTECGATQIVNNGAQAVARPTCPGCPPLTVTVQVNTAIENNEGVFPDHSASGSLEACDTGLTIVNNYRVAGASVVTWNGAVFTEALGINIGQGALPPGAPPLIYVSGTLSVTIGSVDYTALLTPTLTPNGQLTIDLTPLEAAGAPTQNFTIYITYTVAITEGSLNGQINQSFYDWSQLYLPSFSEIEGCAANNAFNQVLNLTIGRGDLSVGLSPQILNRCATNTVTINVNDNAPGRLTDHIVVTFTSSVAEIMSARNFTYLDSLAAIAPIMVTSSTIGGGRGIITFTLPPNADLNGNGRIQFDIDVNCTGEADWEAGITFQSRCDFPHSHATVRDHVYRAPNLLLFATPIRYTVRTKEVIWKFFVTNNGNLTATNVVITNAVYGLSVVTYTANSGAGNVSVINGSLPISGPPSVGPVFNISELAPNEQREITITANVFMCTPLMVTITARLDCFGTTCVERQKNVDFDTPDPYLLTNNGETADLPMCDPGEVIFTTKNASPDVSLYQLIITETLINLTPIPGAPITMTIYDDNNIVLATTTNFTPEIQATATQTLLIWKPISAPTEVLTWFNELPALHLIRIWVPVQTTCDPPNAPQSFAAASALGPCNNYLGYTENALTLRTLKPDMTVNKQGKVEGGEFGEIIYATPGQTVVWRIEVDNRNTQGSYVAHNVVLSDTWPDNFEFVTATLAFTPYVLAAQRAITWDIGEVEPLDAPLQFFITGTVTGSIVCASVTTNTASLRFGCDADGCTSTAVPQDTARLDPGPNLEVTLQPGPLQTCNGDIPIRIRNLGARAYSNTLTVTLPSGYVYSHTVSSGLTLTQIISDNQNPVFKWDEIPGHDGQNPYQFTLILRVKNSAISGACPVDDGRPVTATMSYDNHALCADKGPFSTTHSVNLQVRTPTFALAKLPETQTIDVGQWITWTIILTNTGNGIAENVAVTDVVGSNYSAPTIIASNGSDGSVPSRVDHVITWTLNNTITPGGVWTATVSAILLASGLNRNVVTATATCATGCETASGVDTAYTTLLQEFTKNPAIQTGTIGSLVVFTFSTFLPDVDAVYQRLTITDTLPAGLGYVSSMLTYTYDGPPGIGPIISSTPTIVPGPLASGNVVWRLGDLSGTVQIDGVITAVIQNVASNENNIRLSNRITMTYTDDGQPYVYTDTADVDIVEPILHLGKSYVTPDGCDSTLFQNNFNSGSLVPPWINPGGGGWSILNGLARNNSNGNNRRIYNGDTTWTDYSFSAMMMSNDTSGDMGLIFRSQATDGNYYRFRWNRNGAAGSYRLERVGVATTTLGAAVNVPYETNRWYHVEIRATGSLLQVFIDGVLALERTDMQWPTGRIGLYANTQNQAVFDDILVTRMNNLACTVGANDLVTYTLTISNQGPLTGYDLVITDAIPAGTSLSAYTFQSDDPAAAIVAQPAPIPGATGVLTWGVNQLAPTIPFNPLAHTAITLTVVLRVSPGITANTVLANQAGLAYDNWLTNTQPTAIVRYYRGGSHSTAVRTVDDGITKTVTFSPLPAATLGTLVTYTIIAPSYPISANLYNVVVTDTIDARLLVLDVISSAAPGVLITNVNGLTNNLRLEISGIPSYTQVSITVTTRISHEWPNPAGDANSGDTITNSAVLTHPTAGQITRTNVVSTNVGEPRIAITKAASITTDPHVAVYTITVVNSGNSPAYGLRITDNLPAGISVTNISNGGVLLPGGRAINWTIDFLDVPPPPGNTLVLTYNARLSEAIYSSNQFTNTVVITSTSLTNTIPGVRSYTDTDTNNFHWPMGRLGNYVWYDLNYDGLQGTHPGEFGINGVVLELFNSTTGQLISTTTTISNGINDGFYIFEYLPLGVTYTVRISSVSYGPGGPLESYTQTLPYISPTNTISDSNASITAIFGGLGYATTTTLTTNFTEDLTLDYGFVSLVEIGNYVWFDQNIDGLQNEPAANGFDGVTVTVTYPDGRVFTTTTTPSGYYTFTVPISMVYTITVVPENFAPGGPLEIYTNTLINQGGNDETDSDGAPLNGGLVITTPAITQNNYSFDFGLVKYYVSLGNYVWFDTNNNGLTDTGEVGVPGVAVELYQDANGDGVFTPGPDRFISTITTNVGGYYTFTHLLPSFSVTQNYLVVITSTNFTGSGPLANYQNSDYMVGGNSDLNSQDHGVVSGTLGAGGYVASTPVTLIGGTEPITDDDTDDTSNLTIDFGFYRLSLGDQVWYDNNNNGLIDGGEAGASGITVRLLNITGTVLATAVTDASGFYTFTNLMSATYMVEIVLPANYTSSTDIDTSANPDNNRNHDDNGVNFVAANVVRSNPVTLTPGYTGLLGNNVVSNAAGSTHNPTVDFGLVQKVSLGNQVWYDMNNNGILDVGEVGVPGVAMELYQDMDGSGGYTPGVDTLISTTTTVAGGYYTFTNLLPTRYPTETYLVVVTSTNFTGSGPLVSYMNSTAVYTGNSDLNERDHGVVSGTLGAGGFVASTPVLLTVGGEPITDGDADNSSNLTIDFGFYELVNLGNRVWLDVDNSGHINGAESGIDGVVVRLYQDANLDNVPDGPAILTDTTANDGYYLFDNLRPGSYLVEVAPSNFQAGGVLSGFISSSGPNEEANPELNGDSNDNGVNNSNPAINGIWSRGVTITVNAEPTAETDFEVGVGSGNADDNNSNLTVDFGFNRPSIQVEKLVNIARVAPNQIVTYTINITNTGQLPLNPVMVTDTLEPGLTYQAGSANPPVSSVSGQQLIWLDVTGGVPLAPNTGVQITFLAAVTTTSATYVNSVLAEGIHPTGKVTDTDTASIVVEDPTVAVDKSVSPPGAVAGIITFTIIITNTGPSILDQVPLIDQFVGPIVYIRGTPSPNTVDNTAQALGWNDLTGPAPNGFGRNLAPNESFVITTVFSLTVNSDTETFTMTNAATVTNSVDVFANNANDDADTVALINAPTAIELLYFQGSFQGNEVVLKWATAVEIDNYGFRILRSASGSLADAVEVGFVPGQGYGSGSGAAYTLTDKNVAIDKVYTYWLVDVDVNGVETTHDPITVRGPGIDWGGGSTTIFLPIILSE